MKHFNYENDVVPKCFCFYDEVIVPKLFAKKNIKIERTCEELLEDIYDTCGKFWNQKKTTWWPETSSEKRCR